MKSFLSRFFSKRAVRATVWTLFSLITLFVLVLRLADWQANRSWSAIQSTLTSEGETLDFPKIAPEPVAEESNFCATPVLHGIADETMGAAKREALAVFALKPRGDSKLPALGNPARTGKRMSLDPWISALTETPNATAGDLLAALSQQDPTIAELTGVLDRPTAQWTPQWRSRELSAFLFAVPMPHYQSSQQLSRALAVRSLAEASRGNAAAAHANVRILTRLAQANNGDPFLIGLLVGSAHASLAANGAWTLCEARLGTAEDFSKLEADFARLDFSKAALLAWRGEMAASASSLEALANTNRWSAREREATLGNDTLGNIHVVPRGFLRQNAAAIAKMQWEYCVKPLRDSGLVALQERSAALDSVIEDLRENPLMRPGSFLAVMAMPASRNIAATVIQSEALATQAGLACALERFFLTHQQYPATLSELGEIRAADPWTGTPMHYERTADGRYRLWSVGPDRVDDGGKRNLDSADPAKTEFRSPDYRGDWVWSYGE